MNNCVAICLLSGLLAVFGSVAGFAAQPSKASVRRESTVAVDPATGRLVRLRVGTKPASKVSLSEARKVAVKTPEVDPATIREMIDQTAEKHGVEPRLIHSVIRVESNYQQKAISPKGAQGLMQLIPSTAKRFGVENPFDPSQNLDGGVRYLKFLTERFNGDLRLALAAYNAGEGAVDRYGDVPPYRETQQYVTKVAQLMKSEGLELERAIADAGITTGAGVRTGAEQARMGDTAIPASPRPPMIRAYTDSEGRLHVETVP